MKSRKLIAKFKPDLAIGTGGYASASVLKVASMKQIPCLIQEQNSLAGITNKWLGKSVQRICTAYDGMEQFFPKEKIVLTGNPVRKDLIAISETKEDALAFFKLAPKKKTLLVLGGSLGARRINQIIERALPFFEKEDVQVIWQCGKLYEDQYNSAPLSAGANLVQVHTFLNNMAAAYTAADIIISRAGALSVSELCLVGKPVIFIPSPNVSEDHQTKNALSISEKNAALLLREKDADADFEKTLKSLLDDTGKQLELSANIKKLAKPNATKDIVDEIEKLLKNKRN
jgi:UDP-N-acetylglucosamine--N-acetylmuramyl-(pentapeptide) pyrophosphoryl-undecaprenol N-acetylglucosamine transferase